MVKRSLEHKIKEDFNRLPGQISINLWTLRDSVIDKVVGRKVKCLLLWETAYLVVLFLVLCQEMTPGGVLKVLLSGIKLVFTTKKASTLPLILSSFSPQVSLFHLTLSKVNTAFSHDWIITRLWRIPLEETLAQRSG